MRFEDKNRTLEPPEGYAFKNAESDGAYMRLTYAQDVVETATRKIIGENVVTIYLNDTGREVGRTYGGVRYKFHEPTILGVAPARRFRIWNGFLLALQGVQEMFK